MGKAASNSHLGIFISPKEICIAQVKVGKDPKPVPEHLIKFPTGFPVKEGMLRPLSLNNEFFSEKAAWVAQFKQAIKRVSWDTSSVVVTFSPQFAILRYFVMPAIDRRFWGKSIPLESKKYIPVSFEEVVYDFTAVPADGGKKLGVLFGLTQRKSVEFITETLKSAGLTLSAIEINSVSMERLFGFLDQKDHDVKGYIHFSGPYTMMLFSHGGFPVLYRETEADSSGGMSERKRLDVKGAVQFVDRYVGGKDYKSIMLSGDGADAWKPVAEKEAAPIAVDVWDAAAQAGIKDSDAASVFACGAALRGRVPGKLKVDISGLTTAASLEKQVQGYVWNITFILGGFLLLLSLIAQTRMFMINSTISGLNSKVMNFPELEGVDADTIQSRIDRLNQNLKLLTVLVNDVDPLAPKLAAVADRIPAELWLTDVQYSNPVAVSESQATTRSLRLNGSTFLKGEAKQMLVESFTKSLKAADEFKPFTPPLGSLDSNMEEGGQGVAGMQTPGSEPGRNVSYFSIVCNSRRGK